MRKNTVNWKRGFGDRFRRVAALWCVCCLLFSCLPLPSRSDVEIQEEVSPSKQMSELLQMPETELKEEIPETQELAEEIEESVEAEEATVLQAVNAPVQVSITYYADAGIPESTELVVREEAETEAAPAEELAPLRKSTAKSLKTMNASPALKRTAASPENHNLSQDDITETADVSLTEWQAGQEAPEIPLYHRTLDISLVAEGEEIEPNPEASILVTVVLPDLKEGLEVEVRHETAAGSVLLESTTEGQQVTFVTDSFSLFDFSAAARQITSWTTDLLENAFYGIGNSAETRHNTIQAESPIEGLSVLEAFSVTRGSDLWMSLRRIADIALGKMESISLYTVANGQLSALVKENISLSDVLRMSLGNFSEFALVKDTGLRRRVEQIGSVLLNGLVPKNASATATDVTEEYTDFVPSRSVEQGEADETSIEQGETVGTENGEAVRTIAAYDISITNDGEEYQPEDKPIEVTIKDEAIATAVANGNAVALWHVMDENTVEKVENFMVSGDTVTFSATGFSVYVVTETTVEKILTAADGNVYKITVTYDGSAQISEGAELVVTEVAEDQYMVAAAAALGVEEEYLLYRKFLDISFRVTDENGEEKIFEPAAPVQVKIELLDVDAGADKLQVVHFGNEGAEKVTATSNENAVVTFSAGEFSVFGFGNVLEPIDTVETDEASVEILGFEFGTQLMATDTPEVEEGLEVLGAYNLSGEAEKLWIKAELKEGVDLTDMESVAVYSVKDSNGEDEAGKTVEELAGMGTITELPTTEFAVVKDSGYRHLSFNLTPDKEENEKTVTLDGMMPKNAEAAATDVTENYTDHEFTESAPIYNEETAPVDGEAGEEEQGEAPDDAGEEQQENTEETEELSHTMNRVTLAAYDICIINSDADYQPDDEHPVDVTITDSRILSGNNIELWHIRDDGSQERVENCTIADGTISFTVTGFSVYVVVDHEGETVKSPRVMFHFIADEATEHTVSSITYYESDPYRFINKQNEYQTTQILKNGESLELIADPSNRNAQFFYGWYVVEPYVIDGTTDQYGIGTSKIYYQWTTHPLQVQFESAITIEESNVAIGSTVHWSINSTSGSGTVDSDGNVHVLLAPIFEKYNFANFMLYQRGTVSSSANNLMTRKMIAKGSSDSLEVKISDIRSNSTDPVHLIFIGWEYNAGTVDNPNWVQIQTVEYSGAEKKDAGRDGTYLVLSDVTDTKSVDLYPVFVEARWVDFFSGSTGSGAEYVASRFRESWGTPNSEPYGMTPDSSRNVFSSLPVPERQGYVFDGWYAFATKDNEDHITNLDTASSIEISYIDSNHDSHDTTITTTAIQIADGNGNIVYTDGAFSANGNALFTNYDDNGTNVLKLYNPLDRLMLYAKWVPAESTIQVVYWTENAQDVGYTSTGNEKDDYSASVVKTITTTQINTYLESIGSSTRYSSNSTITIDGLEEYKENSVSILERAFLDEVNAVPAGEEKFYDLNKTLSDSSVVINGDGSTTFNVYFSRKTFKLVFHLGRDGYVKQNGQQRPGNYNSWDGNWIQYMYYDPKTKDVLGYSKGPTAQSYPDPYDEKTTYDPTTSYSMTYNGTTYDDFIFSMEYNGRTYDSTYATTSENVKGDYVPGDGENVYVITAKYGAYIGDRWPTPVNPNFTFTDPTGSTKSMYIWAGYYGSLYCGISHSRTTSGNVNGSNPDINGIYNYMSAELCSNREGTDIINENQVHHLVAYYGQKGKGGIIKNYHIYYEAIDGTYDPDTVQNPLLSGTDYLGYSQTTWSATEGDADAFDGHQFYWVSDTQVISNLEPQYQLGSNIDGYELIYSFYDVPSTDNYHIYFFYRPRQYTLTFMYENEADRKVDTYYYTQTLAEAKKEEYVDPSRVGYEFKGWFTNQEGLGEPFDFANESMPSANVVLYPVLKILQYTVKIDPNGGVIDHRANSSQSTYFTANYGTPVGEYQIEREFIKLSSKEQDSSDPLYYDPSQHDWYYYVNTQFIGKKANGTYGPDGDWGYPADLRNAVYLTAAELDAYYTTYSTTIDGLDSTYWTNITKLTKQEFIDTYTDYPYRPIDSEHYTFMGWYKVYSNGTVDTMPYNFNDPVTGPLELRAKWRLDGGYYLQYNPYFLAEDEHGNRTLVVGELEDWMDPEDPTSQLYADQSLTHILRAPTNQTNGWVFRGWRVVRRNDTDSYTSGTTTYYQWDPIQLDANGDPIYYQPGDTFIVDSSLVTENPVHGSGSIIHVQAYYELSTDSARRPEITNLKLDANGGYITKDGSTELTVSENLPDLCDVGTVLLDVDNNNEQVVFGDIQSNTAVHLSEYADNPNYFKYRTDNYLLIGFDEAPNENDYIATYPADAVIAVQRTDNETLYAVWEQMIYITFVNTTSAPITVNLEGTGLSTISIINVATGKFDRVVATSEIVVPARDNGENGSVTVVLPAAEHNTDVITATVNNDHPRTKMSASGEFQNASYGTANSPVPYGSDLIYQATLQRDPDGITVTYTEEAVREVLYDVNGGVWEETSTDYEERITAQVYALPEDNIVNNEYKPTDPTLNGKIFVGWTEYADIAVGHTDYSGTAEVTWGTTTITPDAGSNLLEKIKSTYLWDFSQPAPLEDKVLYAVWSDAVTVTYNLIRSGTNMHKWSGPATKTTEGNKVFYRPTPSSNVTYTLMRGERLSEIPAIPDDPTAQGLNGVFMEWITVDFYTNTTTTQTTISPYIFDFSQPINYNTTLHTSWKSKNNYQVYTFTVRNVVDPINTEEEFTYRIYAEELKKFNGTSDVIPTFGSVTTQLKHNETYTVTITIEYEQNNGTHNYHGYDVYLEIRDRDGQLVPGGFGHILQLDGDPEARANYKYTIRVAQENKTGYITNVSTDATGESILMLDKENNNQFTFTSKTGTRSDYTPNTNAFAGGVANNKSSTITFTNLKKNDLTITKDLITNLGGYDPIFIFTLNSITDETTGAEYPYTKERNNVNTGSGWITTTSGSNSFTLQDDETITISLPPNKAVTIEENNPNSSYTVGWATSDSTATLSANNASATLTLTGDAAATVSNSRETRTVTVEKNVTNGNTTDSFTFTATLTDGETPISGYTVDTGLVTNTYGQASFNLSHGGSRTLTIPYGAKLVVSEAVSVNYNPSTVGVDLSDDDAADGSFTVNNLTVNGTISFTNEPTTVQSVIFDVNGGTWTTTPNFNGLQGDLFAITENDITDNAYKPNDPTCSGKIFIGWTANAELAAETDFSGTSPQTFDGQTFTPTPGTDEILLDKVRSEGLWDFSQNPPYDQRLYAVWSDTVTVTFDIVRTGSNLHTWEGPATTNTQAPYVYYRSSGTSGAITYTLAKGERVPKPSDPTTNQTNWIFVSWLKNYTGYRNSTKQPSEDNIRTNTYDFTDRVDSPITLSTSWTTNQPQIFTFKVKTEVIHGPVGEEFTYTIGISDVWLIGKVNNTNTVINPDTDWGSISTQLKNNEEYKVIVTVAYNTASWNGNSVNVEVVDRDGIVIKTGHLLVHDPQSKPNFASDYRYTLSITQTEKSGYTTTVETRDPIGSITFDPPSNRTFTFVSKEYRSKNVKNATATFSSEVNNYCDGTTENIQDMHAGNHGLTIVFTNTSPSRNLTVTKTVAGTDDTSDTFNFTAEVEGITDVSYWWQKYATSDGTTYTAMTGAGSKGTGTLTSSENTVNFMLRHHQKIVIEGLPENATVNVTEINGEYTASWLQDGTAITQTDGTGTSAVTVELTADTTLDVTNTKSQEEIIVAPTGINTRHTPFLLLLLFGLMLLIGGVGVMKKRAPEDLQAETTAISATSTEHNNRPPEMKSAPARKASRRTKVTSTDAETHRRSSVWVNNAPNCGYDQRGYVPPQIRDIPCPQAKLWQNDSGGGGAG